MGIPGPKPSLLRGNLNEFQEKASLPSISLLGNSKILYIVSQIT